MNRIKSTLTAATLALATCSAPVYAQARCGPTDDAYEVLTNKYGEERHSYGAVQGGIIETWVNDVTGSWTIIATSADGVSCIVMSGMGFERTVRGNV
jgi:hypothetical protein